jgi:hypothetical protein
MRPMYELLLCGTKDTGIGIYHLHRATPEQLCRLHYKPGSLKGVKRHLKTLVVNQYVQFGGYAVEHRAEGRIRHSTRYYYTMGPEGMRYLANAGYDVNEAWRAAREVDKHGLFVAHELQLNDIIIAAALIKKADPRFYLESFTHERILKRRPYKVRLPDNQRFSLIPDAFLDFRNTFNSQHFPVLLEHDRGTEEQFFFKRKIHAYIALLTAQAFREMFGATTMTVAFTTFEGERRLMKMREWTRQVLAQHNVARRIGTAFRFAALPQPLFPGTAWLDPRWQTAYDEQPPHPLLAA